MYARSRPFPTHLLQPPANLPEGPRSVGVLVLGLSHLGVGELAPLGQEDRVPTETAFAPGLLRDLTPILALKDPHLTPVIRDRNSADGARTPVLAAEHPQEATVADARDKPLRQRPWEAVPGP